MNENSKLLPSLNSLIRGCFTDTRVWMLPFSTTRLKLVRITHRTDSDTWSATTSSHVYKAANVLKNNTFQSEHCCLLQCGDTEMVNGLWLAEVCPGQWEDHMPRAPWLICDQIHRELSLSVFPKLPATVGKVITQTGDTHETWNTEVGNETWCFEREMRE